MDLDDDAERTMQAAAKVIFSAGGGAGSGAGSRRADAGRTGRAMPAAAPTAADGHDAMDLAGEFGSALHRPVTGPVTGSI